MRFDRAFVLPFPAAFVLEMAADRNLMRFHQTIRAVWRNKGELKNCLDILSSLFLLSFKLTGKLIENSRVKTVFPANYSDILIRKVRIDRNLSFVLKSEYFSIREKTFLLKKIEDIRRIKNLRYLVETNIEFLTRRTFCKGEQKVLKNLIFPANSRLIW